MKLTGKQAIALQIALATFGILVLELALIRWTSHQVRVFAYFNNLTLMAAFLGMGLGVALGARKPELHHWTLPSLLVLSVLLGLSEELRVLRLYFPDLSVHLWGSEGWRDATMFATNLLVVLLLFALIVELFVCAGAIVGSLFNRMEPLRAYSADLVGSLIGVLVMTAVAALGTAPPVWFAIGGLPFLLFSRRLLSLVSFAGVLFLSWWSIGHASYSPYSRIDMDRDASYPGAPIRLVVNRDFHQYMQDLSVRSLSRPGRPAAEREALRDQRLAYSLPFRLTGNRDRALVVGAGSGNDVAAALRSGFGEVVSVDIDPLIMKLGKAAHPERPYDDPRAVRIVNDARAYFEQNPDQTFDVVCFSLLDSHTMFSAMSSLRLENYVYTIQSIRSAYDMVRPGGILTLTFATQAGEWISDRIYSIIWEATGVPPIMVQLPGHGRTWIVGKEVSLAGVTAAIPFQRIEPTRMIEWIRVPTDDWPFLYLRPGTFPMGYLAVIGGLLLIAFFGARVVFGESLFRRGRFDLPLFLMGAAFLLIETRGIVDLSLLFGSTWIVNVSVFAGILLMALLANFYVQRFRPAGIEPFFFLLVAALLLNYFVRPGMLLDLSLWVRGIVGGLANAIPVGFAGVIFSIFFRRSKDPAASLGSNLLGALVGGCLEYLSMMVGLKALALVALVIYLSVLFLYRTRMGAGESVATAAAS